MLSLPVCQGGGLMDPEFVREGHCEENSAFFPAPLYGRPPSFPSGEKRHGTQLQGSYCDSGTIRHCTKWVLWKGFAGSTCKTDAGDKGNGPRWPRYFFVADSPSLL